MAAHNVDVIQLLFFITARIGCMMYVTISRK